MKKIVLLFAALAVFINIEDAKADYMQDAIHTFYSEYIEIGVKEPSAENNKKMDSLKKLYCSQKLLDEETDYDIIINGQDFFDEWVRTITVKKDITKNDTYYVSLFGSYSTENVNLKLIIKDEKIDEIIQMSDPYQTINEEDVSYKQWYGYYSVEVNDSLYTYDDSDEYATEEKTATYAISFNDNECKYYALRLRSNDIFDCEMTVSTPDYISFKAIGDFIPNTEGKPIATLHKKDDKYQIVGPFIFNNEGNANILIDVKKKNDDNYKEWYGYYSADVHLPYMIEPEAQTATYAVNFKENECSYYNLRLHANDVFDCEIVEATPEYISFKALGDFAPNTRGEPIATLHKKDDKYYISGPYFSDANHNNILFEVERKKTDS